MALYDWNRDGKKDAADDFIEFNIMKSMSKESSGNNYSYGHSGGTSNFWTVVMLLGVIVIMGVILDACQTKCAYPGCTNEPAEGSDYCYLHRTWTGYHSGSSYKTNNSTYTSEDYSTNDSTDNYSSDSTVDNYKTDYSNSGNYNSSYNEDDDDPYDAKSYSDAEDFYDDNYEDFDGFEDAEDYYDEHYEED